MSDQHNILIVNDWDCAIVLAGVHRKVMRHTTAEVYTEDTTENCAWDSTTKSSWKLHVIVHGSHEPEFFKLLGKIKIKSTFLGINKYGYVHDVSPMDLAQMIKDSTLPNSPHAKVRLDICFAGRGGKKSLAYLLKQKLGKDSKISVSAVPGSDIIGWGTAFDKLKTRMVVNPKHIHDDSGAQSIAGKIWNKAISDNQREWNNAETLAKTVDSTMTSTEIKTIASQVYPHAKKALKDFYDNLVKADKALRKAKLDGLLMEKTKGYKKTY